MVFDADRGFVRAELDARSKQAIDPVSETTPGDANQPSRRSALATTGGGNLRSRAASVWQNDKVPNGPGRRATPIAGRLARTPSCVRQCWRQSSAPHSDRRQSIAPTGGK
jgi:hypothetical protein